MKLVIFDCDGVLVNSEELVELAERDAFAEYGVDYSLHDLRELFSGLSYDDHNKKREEEYKKRTGKDLPASFLPRLEQLYRAREARDFAAIAGIHDLIRSLKQAGVPFCVASNSGIVSLERKLMAAGLHEFFDPNIFSREHVARGKPAPDVYLYAAKKMGNIDPAQCIVVEDSAPGVTAGACAGMHVIGIARQDQALPADPYELLAAGAKETVPSAFILKDRIFSLLGQPIPGNAPKNCWKPPQVPPPAP